MRIGTLPWTALALAGLSLSACPEDAPSDDEAGAPACCSVDEVIAMSRAGVDDELIVRSIQQGERGAPPGPADLIRLSDAQVSKPVVEAMMGQAPVATAEDGDAAGSTAPTPAPDEAATRPGTADSSAAPTAAGPPPLSLAVAYVPGSKTLTITNNSGVTYTGVVLTANDEYLYALPIALPPGNPDRIKLGAFNSPKTGHKLNPAEGIRSLRVKAQQGHWSQRF